MEPGKYYHVFNRSVNNEVIFKNNDNYEFFLLRFGQYVKQYINVYAYCLMPTHFHFLVRLKEDRSVSENVQKGFKNLFISYSKAYNKMYDRHGSVFQNKYKKKEITDNDYLGTVISYIHLNPCKDRLVFSPEDWKYSSYREVLAGRDHLIALDEILEWCGGIDQFKKVHKENLKEMVK